MVMKANRIIFLMFVAMILAFGFVVACGDDDDDNDDSGDDTTPASCEEAMAFLFGSDGCFTLTDAEDNTITPNDLCGGEYDDVTPCYTNCYDDNDDCNSMGDCLTADCGLSF
jgi:cytochrome oxidase Cu insertion factor (SCO1/SenC/PrrC family)